MNNAPLQGSRLITFMAAGTGLSIASNFYAQPLLALLAMQFGVSVAQAGLIVTFSQVGYIAGLVLLVPLGDRLERRALLTFMCSLAALSLLGTALAPNFWVFAAMALIVALSSVSTQIIVPLSAHLAEPERRSQTVSSVMAGLLLGVLLARTAAGTIAEFAGWRTVYFSAAACMGCFAVLCWLWLPRVPPTASGSYRTLLASLWRIFRDEPVLRTRGLLGFLSYSMLAGFWTTMAFMLSERHGLSEVIIGLFALLGALSVLLARLAGKLADAGWARVATGGFLLLAVLSWLWLYLGQASLPAFAVGVVLLDLGVQCTHLSSQSEVFRLRPEARSRIATCYMSCYFGGGVMGSALSASAYGAWGWTGTCVLGVVMGLITLVAWCVLELRWPLGAMRRPAEQPSSQSSCPDSDIQRTPDPGH